MSKKSSEERAAASDLPIISVCMNGKEPPDNPWVRMQGMLADEPLFDEWQLAIQEHRRLRDEEDRLP